VEIILEMVASPQIFEDLNFGFGQAMKDLHTDSTEIVFLKLHITGDLLSVS